MFPADPLTATFCAIDFETADREADSACQVGLCRVEGGAVVRTHAVLVRPPRQEFAFTHVHGLTWASVEKAEPFGPVWGGIGDLIASCAFLVAHNAPFDRRTLLACCRAAGLPAPDLPWVCTQSLARKRWPGERYGLGDVCGRLGIPLTHHEAGSDAEACARVLLALAGELAADGGRAVA